MTSPVTLFCSIIHSDWFFVLYWQSAWDELYLKPFTSISDLIKIIPSSLLTGVHSQPLLSQVFLTYTGTTTAVSNRNRSCTFHSSIKSTYCSTRFPVVSLFSHSLFMTQLKTSAQMAPVQCTIQRSFSFHDYFVEFVFFTSSGSSEQMPMPGTSHVWNTLVHGAPLPYAGPCFCLTFLLVFFWLLESVLLGPLLALPSFKLYICLDRWLILSCSWSQPEIPDYLPLTFWSP